MWYGKLIVPGAILHGKHAMANLQGGWIIILLPVIHPNFGDNICF